MSKGNLTEKELLQLCKHSEEFDNAYTQYRQCWKFSEENPPEAYRILSNCLPIFKLYGADSLISLCECLRGKSSMLMGNFELSEQCYAKGEKIARKCGFSTGLAFNLMYYAILKARQNHIETALIMWQESEEICHRMKRTDLIPNIIFNKGTALVEAGKYVEAFELFTQSLETFRELNDDARIANTFTSLATIYFILGDKEQALDYTLKSLQYVGEEPHLKLPILVNAATNFCDLKIPDKGILYLEEASILALKFNDGYHIAFTDKIQAEYYSYYGEYSRAKPLFIQASESFRTLEAMRPYTYCIYELALIAEKELHHEKAIELLESLLPLLNDSVDDPVLLCDCYVHLSELYSLKNNIGAALDAERKYGTIRELWLDHDRRRLFALHEIKMKLKEKQYEIEQLENENTLLQIENEKKIKEISVLAMSITQKNNIIQTINNELRNITKSRGNDGYIEKIEKLSASVESYLHSNREWEIFEKRFDMLFPDYQKKILQKFSDLTPSELRICILLKADLSTKEISSILCISGRAVEGHRLNIRRKLMLDPKEPLVRFLQIL